MAASAQTGALTPGTALGRRWRQGGGPRLMLLTDLSLVDASTLLESFALLASSARVGSVCVQLRDPDRSARERLELGRELRRITQAHGQGLAVNDRLDLALLLEADAVHLRRSSVRVGDARSLMGEDCFISAAWHEPEKPPEAELDAVVLSPICAPRKGREALGIDGLRRFRARLDEQQRPPRVYALGGVTAETADACLDAGAAGVAVIGAAFERDVEVLLSALRIAA